MKFKSRSDAFPGNGTAYVVAISGDAMSPAAERGHLAWVEPHRPVKAGDLALVRLNDGRAVVRRVKKRRAAEMIVEQFNPPRNLRIANRRVKHVHLVVAIMRVAA